MTIREYHQQDDPALWLDQLLLCDWRAGRYLCRVLTENLFFSEFGPGSRLLLLTEGEKLLSFCVYARQDCVPIPSWTPWAGFVYTFPACRGKRRAGKLLERVYQIAKEEGHPWVYLATEEEGLYEKYGFVYWKNAQDRHGAPARIYRLAVKRQDYSQVLGTRVSGKIDRPLGSGHPRHPEMIYPINYGYVEGVMAGDGAEQDVYLFGTDQPVRDFTGTVTGVYHRLNDCEDKWIVCLDGKKPPSREEILSAIAFQEQYFMGELYL